MIKRINVEVASRDVAHGWGALPEKRFLKGLDTELCAKRVSDNRSCQHWQGSPDDCYQLGAKFSGYREIANVGRTETRLAGSAAASLALHRSSARTCTRSCAGLFSVGNWRPRSRSTEAPHVIAKSVHFLSAVEAWDRSGERACLCSRRYPQYPQRARRAFVQPAPSALGVRLPARITRPACNLIEPWWKIMRSLALKGRRFETWAEIEQAVERGTAYWNEHKLHPHPTRLAGPGPRTCHAGSPARRRS